MQDKICCYRIQVVMGVAMGDWVDRMGMDMLMIIQDMDIVMTTMPM